MVNPLCAKLRELGFDCSSMHDSASSDHNKAEWVLLAALGEAEEEADNRLSLLVDLLEDRYRQQAQIDRLVEAIRDVAVHSLRYCEERYGHDDQARLNLEALLAEITSKSADSSVPAGPGALAPALVAKLEHGLLLKGEKELAEQVASLAAVASCGCADPDCYGFFTVDPASIAGRQDLRTITLSEKLFVQADETQIVYVEAR